MYTDSSNPEYISPGYMVTNATAVAMGRGTITYSELGLGNG